MLICCRVTTPSLNIQKQTVLGEKKVLTLLATTNLPIQVCRR